jgi:hypothetical protein
VDFSQAKAHIPSHHRLVSGTGTPIGASASHWSGTMQRRVSNTSWALPDRLAEDAERLRAEAEKLPHGHEGICS